MQTRKIKLVQEFLNLQDEGTVLQLEKLLYKEKNDSGETAEPVTEEDLNQRIDRSEDDFQNKRYKQSSELLSKYD